MIPLRPLNIWPQIWTGAYDHTPKHETVVVVLVNLRLLLARYLVVTRADVAFVWKGEIPLQNYIDPFLSFVISQAK